MPSGRGSAGPPAPATPSERASAARPLPLSVAAANTNIAEELKTADGAVGLMSSGQAEAATRCGVNHPCLQGAKVQASDTH